VVHSLIAHRLTFSSILQEVPLKVRTNPLVSAFLDTITSAPTSSGADTHAPISSSSAAAVALPPSFAALDLGGAPLARRLEQLIDAADASRTEEGNLAYLQRQIARERARADAYVAKRREDSAARVAQGLAPLPEEDVSRLFKIPPEPSRLENMLLLGQVDAHAKALESAASIGLAKMYAARASAGV
jgi:translation initiation factor 3 subunit H